MLKISEKTNFGIFLLLSIAENEAISLRDVVKRWPFMSQGYLEEIAAALKKAGFIVGRKGKGGGYRLAKPAGAMTLLDVVNALEGTIAIVETSTHIKMRNATLAPHRSGASGAGFFGWCVSRRLWGKVQQNLEKTLQEITLADLVHDAKKYATEIRH
ncbi:Rrf2 family transcriptional regulator [Candidatus Uhrbacteria bacterium]|nr:Rrf2 family transcriptional regulator [Candidatus Uhrbacteria bacterium]